MCTLRYQHHVIASTSVILLFDLFVRVKNVCLCATLCVPPSSHAQTTQLKLATYVSLLLNLIQFSSFQKRELKSTCFIVHILNKAFKTKARVSPAPVHLLVR